MYIMDGFKKTVYKYMLDPERKIKNNNLKNRVYEIIMSYHPQDNFHECLGEIKSLVENCGIPQLYLMSFERASVIADMCKEYIEKGKIKEDPKVKGVNGDIKEVTNEIVEKKWVHVK